MEVGVILTFQHFNISAFEHMNDFSEQLKNKKEELYGVTSQLRRATLSVVLNYIEGFARAKKAVKQNFWEISYGSLKESKYLVHFSLIEKYIDEEDYKKIIKLSEEIGAMLWCSIQPLK